jgi:hypothetical protein
VNSKNDPIRESYYAPLEKAEHLLAWSFYITATISVLILLVDRGTHPDQYEVLQLAFVVLALFGFFVGLAIRFYWAPRAAEKRVADFLSNAFEVELSPERTSGYYNNDEQQPFRKVASQTAENAFFTKEVARLMCGRRRLVVGIYALLWITVVAHRGTPIDMVVIGCQVLFSEEVLTSVVRLEWLRAKSERIFDSMFRQLGQGAPEGQYAVATVVESLVCYEMVKAAANVTLSSAVFDRNNARLSKEWDQMRANAMRSSTDGN